MPQDSEAVLFVNVRQLSETPRGRQHLAPLIRHLFEQAAKRLRWFDYANINPLSDLDTLRISFAPVRADNRYCRCRSDRSLSLSDRSGLNSRNSRSIISVSQGHNEHAAKRTTLLAPLGDMLVVGETRDSVQAALRQAIDPQPILSAMPFCVNS